LIALELRGIVKRFGRVAAVDGVTLRFGDTIRN
jgi:ABC-type sugar transport system ATPase subunit